MSTPAEIPTYHVEEVNSYTRNGSEYSDLRLPSEIRRLNLKLGSTVRLEKQEDDSDPYILGKRRDNYESYLLGDYKIRGSEKSPVLTIPKDWREDFLKHEGVQQLLLEVNPEAGELRIYNIEHFFDYRYDELDDINQGPPIVVGSIGSLFQDNDPSHSFKFIPFDAQHRVFERWTDKPVDGKYSPDPELLDKIIRMDQLPRCRPGKLTIRWDPDGQRNVNSDRGRTLYTERNLKEASHVLPTKGSFQISTRTWVGEHGTSLNYSEVHDWKHIKDWELTEINGWEGKYLAKREDCMHVYVPCQSKK